MQIVRTYVPDSYANYNHLVYCPATRQAAAVDPFDAEHLLTLANERNLKIVQIWLTHEHGDHTRQMADLQQLTQAPIYAPQSCQGRLAADYWLADNTQLTLGDGSVQHWLTPGHTPGHGVFYYHDPADPGQNFLVCGDTLFNAGVGNTRSGNTETLYHTLTQLLPKISPQTRLFSGHDYIETNLKFTLHHCPELSAAAKTLQQVSEQTPETRAVKTLADEQQYNLFLRLDTDPVKALCSNTELSEAGRLARFSHLRRLRDQW